MRRAAAVGLGLLFVLGVGGAGRQAPEPVKSALREEAEPWLYPKAKVVSTAESAGRVFQTVLTTADDVEAVLKHYDRKCGTLLAAADNPPGALDSQSEVADGKTTLTLTADDSAVPVPSRRQGTPRGVVLRQLTRDESGCFVTVLVTRTKEDAATHLLITYLKKS
jgi:hypothetical protein